METSVPFILPSPLQGEGRGGGRGVPVSGRILRTSGMENTRAIVIGSEPRERRSRLVAHLKLRKFNRYGNFFLHTLRIFGMNPG